MSSNTNIGNTPVNQGYVQLFHTGETGGLDTTLRQMYDGDGTASDLYVATNKVKIGTTLYIGSDTLAEYIQDTVGAMFDGNTETNITVTYQDSDGTIDLVSSGDVTLTNSVTLTNKTLTSPVINTGVSGTAILDEDNMASDSATKLATQQSIKAYVDAEVAGVVDSAPGTLNTLNELAAALGDDANYAASTTTAIGLRALKSNNLSDLDSASTARSNLGLGSLATLSAVNASTITDNSVGADELNVSGDGSSSQFLRSDGDGTFTWATPTDTNTTYTGGTNLTLDGTEFNVDDAFLKNNANDTTSGTITAGGFTTTGTWTFDDFASGTVGITAVQSGNTFNDNDTSLMTAGAIKDKIEGYGYTTNTGDITGVDLTGANGIAISSESNTTSGNYSSTIGIDISTLTALSSEPADEDLFVVEIATDGSIKKLAYSEIKATSITIDGTTANGVLTYGGTNNIDTEANLTFDGGLLSVTRDNGIAQTTVLSLKAYDSDGDQTASLTADLDFHLWDSNTQLSTPQARIGVVGNSTGTQNAESGGILAFYTNIANYSSPSLTERMRIDEEGDVTIQGGSLTLPVAEKLYFGGGTHTYIGEDVDDRLRFFVGGSEFMRFTESSSDTIDLYHNTLIADDKYLAIGSSHDMEIKHISDQNYIDLDNGNLYFRDDGDNNIFTIYREGGGVQLNEGDVKIPATSKLYLDGGSDTYIHESSADTAEIYVGGVRMLQLSEASTDYVSTGDNTLLGVGDDVDMYMKHDTSNSYIVNGTGDLVIRNNADDKDILFQTDNNYGDTTNYIALDGSAKVTHLYTDTALAATKKLYLDGGSNTYITESSADRVKIFVGGDELVNIIEDTTSLFRLSDDVQGTFGNADDIKIYHNSSSGNANIENHTGSLYVTNYTDDGDIFFRVDDGGSNVITAIQIDASAAGSVFMPNDNATLGLGAGNDLRLWHDATNSYVYNYQGELRIGNTVDDADTVLFGDDGSGNMTAYLTLDGSATKTTLQKDLRADDDVKIQVGSSGDFYMVHDSGTGQGQLINGTDHLVIVNNADDHDIILKSDNGSGGTAVYMTLDGSTTDLLLTPPGNVGIGTTSPDEVLHIFGSSPKIKIENSAESSGGILFVDQQDESQNAKIFFDASARSLDFHTDGAEAMTITGTSDGRQVGIGTTSPSSPLHISKETSTSASSTGTTLFTLTNDVGSDLNQQKTFVDFTLLDDNANETPQVRIGAEVGQNGDADTQQKEGSGAFVVYTNNADTTSGDAGASLAERMRIDYQGNVGIGTTSPYERLYVQCEDATSPGIVSNPAATNGAIAYAIGYGDANRDYINTWGMSYSAGANVFGYGVKPKTDADEEFINSADNANFKRGALYFDDELKFFNAAATTGTIDTAITMTERFRVDVDGDGFFDRDVVAYSTTVSDKRLKDNVKTIDNAVDKVMKLRGVEFDWNATSRKGQHDLGLIAQEVEQVLPELVREKNLCTGEFGGKGNEKEFKTVDYDKIVGVLIEAIKEQQEEIECLKANYDQLKYNRR